MGDTTELLYINVDQITGTLVLVASDRLTGGTVDVGEPIEPAPPKDCVHGRGLHPEPIGDLDRTQALLPPQVHDLSHHGGRGPVGLVVRA
ncbi:uncharacterized protein PD653_1204 [Nocardioides sp. PD653]|nr:uncharacterized protein PD653B2_0207 [Nocardioides sp. PD653-B2]GAW53800.1 uncharacterized protein PD653_1204 [Nocardioides sp. PD653]